MRRPTRPSARWSWVAVVPLALLVADTAGGTGAPRFVTLSVLPTPAAPTPTTSVDTDEDADAAPSPSDSGSPSPSGLVSDAAPGPGTVAFAGPPPAPAAPTAGGFALPADGSSVTLATVRGSAAMTAAAVGDPSGTTDVVVWMDPHLLRFDIRPGTSDPGGSFPGHASSVSPADPVVVAAFNSGFKLADSQGGLYLGGKTVRPLRDGAASFVTYADGSATIGAWNQSVAMSSSVVGVRQNLDLLVSGGVANPSAKPDSAAPWGATLNNAIATNRSGLGVRGDGSLVYVQGPQLTPASLAALLVRAGTVSGMTLDINPMWPLFTFVRRTGAGAFMDKITSTMTEGAGTFTSPSNRDFIAVLSDVDAPPPPASPSPTTQPPTTSPPTTSPTPSASPSRSTSSSPSQSPTASPTSPSAPTSTPASTPPAP